MNQAVINYSELRIIRNRERRNRELKRHIIILFTSLILFVILFAIVLSTKSMAADNSEETLYKYYKCIQIKSGDTLTSISDNYFSDGFDSESELRQEIMFINNIDSEDEILVSGNYLVIPYYDVYKP